MRKEVLLAGFLATILLLMPIAAIPVEGFKTRIPVPAPIPFDPFRILHFGAPLHEDITSAGLNFLKPAVLDDIVNEHLFMESQIGPTNHFDDCRFQGTTQNINALYNRAVNALNPASPDLGDAPDAFGQLLHPVQDFYSHSNWVDSGQTTLIDDGFSLWTVLTPYSIAKGFVIVQGEDIPTGTTVTLAGKSVIVTTQTGTFPGLITGTFTIIPGGIGTDDCPDSASVKHGDLLIPSSPSDLNKDDSSKPGHGLARNLATEQTTHEWCRLVDLVKQNFGRKGVEFLFDNWVNDVEKAIDVCPNALNMKVKICHKPDTTAEKTKKVPLKKVPRHLGHGDDIGKCVREKVTICHKPDTTAEKTKKVLIKKIPKHLRHGDAIGACDAVPIPVCGNNAIEAPEECDDGNVDNNDSCLNSCIDATCGDGVVQTGVEACDDGNNANGDGCSACAVDSGWTCDEQPSACTQDPVCGDNVITPPETCDDGNNNPFDGCHECQLPTGAGPDFIAECLCTNNISINPNICVLSCFNFATAICTDVCGGPENFVGSVCAIQANFLTCAIFIGD